MKCVSLMVNFHLHCCRCCNHIWADGGEKTSIHVKKCDHSVCMTGSGILVMAVGSSGGGWECVTTGPFGPHSCASSSLVWVQRHGPSHRLTFTAGPLCDKNRSRQPPTQRRKWQPLRRLSSQTSRKSGAFLLLLDFRWCSDCPPPWEWATGGRRARHVHVND